MSSWRKDKKARKEKKRVKKGRTGMRRSVNLWWQSGSPKREKKSVSDSFFYSFVLLPFFHFNDLFPHFSSSFQACCFLFVYLYINFFRDLSVHLVPVCFPVWVFVLFHVCPCIFIIFYARACFHWWKLYARQLNFSTLHSHSVCIQITQFLA